MVTVLCVGLVAPGQSSAQSPPDLAAAASPVFSPLLEERTESVTVTLSLNPTTVAEDDDATTVTVTAALAAAGSTATMVTVSVTDGEAEAGVDFGAVADFTLDIAENETSGTATFELSPIDDSLVEGDETLEVSGTGTDLEVIPAELTLTDDDRATLGLDVYETTLAESGAGRATITVSITNAVTFQRAQDVALTLGGTATPGEDYTFTDASGRTFTRPWVLVLPGGESSATGTITAVDDDRDDDAETVTVEAEYDGAAVGATQTITITDDDDAPALALSGLTVASTNSRSSYPVFDADTLHYAVGCEAGDALTLTPETADTNVRLSVNGTQTTSGTLVAVSAVDGDSDIPIVLSTSAGQSRTYTVHCLPDDFPTVTVDKEAGAWDGLLIGSLNLGDRSDPDNRWSFLQVMDTNGVPRFHRKIDGIHVAHFRPQEGGDHPYGYLTTGSTNTVVLLDEHFENPRQILPTVWQSETGWDDAYLDVHDFVNRPDGVSVIVIDDPVSRDLSEIGFGSYGEDESMEDEIILHVSELGAVTPLWNSWEEVEIKDCTQHRFIGAAYTHFNSIELLADGDYLISLKGCSKILKIDSDTGDVLWRIGRSNLSNTEWTDKGRTPPYSIVDDPYGEFCGQHSAKLVGNGNLLLYDNGAHCLVDPDTSTRERQNNQFSRVVEYALDHQSGQARFLRHHSLGSEFDAYTGWTGLVAPMDNGNWWISWGGASGNAAARVTQSITEVDPETNKELLHILFEDGDGDRETTRSYPLRHDEFRRTAGPLTARVVSAPVDPVNPSDTAEVVIAFSRPIVDPEATTPSVSVSGGAWTVAPHLEGGAPANAYLVTLTGTGRTTTFSLAAGKTCANGGVCTLDGATLEEIPPVRTIRWIVAPGAPANLAATPAGARMTLSWNPPADDGDSAITDYEYRRRLTGGTAWGPWTSVGTSVGSSTATSHTVTGLVNGSSYDFEVRAVNIVGAGVGSAPVRATPANLPPAFADSLYARSVAENSPQNTAVGSPVTATDPEESTVGYSLSGAGSGLFTVEAGGQIRTAGGASLDHETGGYRLTITASDGSGGSAAATVTISVSDVDEPPVAPVAPVVQAASRDSVRVSWIAPVNVGRPPILDYDVEYRLASSSGAYLDAGHNGAATTTTVAGLMQDTSYAVRVRARNDEGAVEWSNPGVGSTANSPATGAPLILGTARVRRTLTASTGDIMDANGLGVFSFQWRADGAVISGATRGSYRLTFGERGKMITVTVSFTDDAGFGESVTGTAVGPVLDPPPPPPDPGDDGGDDPGDDGGGDVEPPKASALFEDVRAGVWYEPAVSWMILHRVTSGCAPTLFCPDASLTRRQFVTFLWRAAGRPTPSYLGSEAFGDVTEGGYAEQSIGWAVANGITRGCTPGQHGDPDWMFCPTQTVTRGQMSTLLYRHVETDYQGGAPRYTDVEPDRYYAPGIAWLTDFEVVPGCGPDLFCPDRAATRGEAALFINGVAIRPHTWGQGNTSFIPQSQ